MCYVFLPFGKWDMQLFRGGEVVVLDHYTSGSFHSSCRLCDRWFWELRRLFCAAMTRATSAERQSTLFDLAQ